MAIRSRREKKAVVTVDDWLDAPVEEPVSSTPSDPAQVAVGFLLQHALTAATTDFEAAGRDGVIVLVYVTEQPWSRLALDEWQAKARNGQEHRDGYRENWYKAADWLTFSPTEPGRSHSLEAAADQFARAVAASRHCAAFTSDLSWLPSDIVLAADYHLRLPPLTGDDLMLVAGKICCDKPSVLVSDAQAALVTPRLLRLARRPVQTADAYLRKLQELLERDLAPVAAAQAAEASAQSIRDAPTLGRLHGMDAAVAWGLSVKKDLALFKDGRISWSDVDRGLLLSGPPGCGKTVFARALATNCGIPLVSGSYAQWHGTGNAHQGDLLKAMKATFRKARESAPSVLFIDEVDSFSNRGTITHHYADWEIQVVNALLAEIDGVEGRDGVILLAACNFPEKLDPALVRSGRLDRHIKISRPNRAAMAAILREHLGDDLAGQDLLAAALAGHGSTGADCERFVRGARRRARDARRPMVVADLMAEIGGSDDRTAAELKLGAIHEAGHALDYCELLSGSLRAVTLRGAGDSGGMASAAFQEAYVSAQDVRRQLVVALAGRAAEEVILHVPSSACGGGPTSDLAVATCMAAAAATAFGLDESIGLVWAGVPDPTTLPRMFRDSPALAARVRLVVDEAYTEALALIRRRSPAVKAVAAALLSKRALDGDETAAIVAKFPARALS
jgi:cell division protease FtsH